MIIVDLIDLKMTLIDDGRALDDWSLEGAINQSTIWLHNSFLINERWMKINYLFKLAIYGRGGNTRFVYIEDT